MASSLHLGSLGCLAGFLALFPILSAACGIFLLLSGVLVVPVCLAWFIYHAAQEELDPFSFPMVLQSVTEDFAISVGLKQESNLTAIETENNDYYRMSLRTKALNPRRESFISDFNEPEEEGLNHGNPRKRYYLSSSSTQATASKTGANIPRRTGGYAILSSGISYESSESSSLNGTPSPSFHSAASILTIEGFLRTPDRRLFDLSSRTISPHWSVGKPVFKSGTPSPLELSPGELEYPDERLPSPKRWPSPVSDIGYTPIKEESLRIRLQKATFSEYIEGAERISLTGDVGSTHISEIGERAQADITNTQLVNYLPGDHDPPSPPPKLKRKLFTADLEDKKSVDPDTSPLRDTISTKTDVFSTEYNDETALTIGWSHRYKDLIVELKGSLGKQESEDEGQSRTENSKPTTDADQHWMDSPRLEPLERPRLNKLQRWGLVHRASKGNLISEETEVAGQRDLVSKPSDFPSLPVSQVTLKEDYNFGNLEVSLEQQGGQSDSDDNDEYSKAYWDGFDEAYNICDSNPPGYQSEDEEKWKLSMGKWAEKGVEVMKPVNEESREDGSARVLPGLKRAMRWPSPLSESSDQEPLLLHDSLTAENENVNGSFRLTTLEDLTPRTPSPLLPLPVLGEKTGFLEDGKKDSTPLGETSNRLFSRRLARASRLPVLSSPTLTPPRPLPVKLIRMFEDLSKPLSISPRSSSINSSPERIHSSPERNDGSRGNEVRGAGPDIGDVSPAAAGGIRKRSALGSKDKDDGFNECF